MNPVIYYLLIHWLYNHFKNYIISAKIHYQSFFDNAQRERINATTAQKTTTIKSDRLIDFVKNNADLIKLLIGTNGSTL